MPYFFLIPYSIEASIAAATRAPAPATANRAPPERETMAIENNARTAAFEINLANLSPKILFLVGLSISPLDSYLKVIKISAIKTTELEVNETNGTAFDN